MSHVTPIKTEIRDLECADRAAEALTIPTFGPGVVHSYYSQRQADGSFSKDTPVDLVLGKLGYGVGLKLQPDGTYAVICDVFDCDKNMLAKFGPTFHKWERGRGNGRVSGHVPVGRPTKFLQAYAVQVAIKAADAGGYRYEAEIDGVDIVLTMTGGELLAGQEIRFRALADGSTIVSVHNVDGPECVRASNFLEELLGSLTGREHTAEYYHGTGNVHVDARLTGR